MNLKEFIAKQLNDHRDSPSGVVQDTYFEWTESHISDAIKLGVSYLYSLLPEKFTKVKEHVTTTGEDCTVQFCTECDKFMGVVDVVVDGVGCSTLVEDSGNVFSLSSMLSTGCENLSEGHQNYSWSYMGGSRCMIRFNQPIPRGTTIKYLCAEDPDDINVINDSWIKEYNPLIAEYALWWLYRTDSESKSNLDRAALHFQAIETYVTRKLLLEFSLREDDYDFGRRRVDD